MIQVSKPISNMNMLHTLLPLLFLYIYTAESTNPSASLCNTNTNISSQISTNINALLSILASGTVQNGFIATSYGRGTDQIYGLAQCRGDVSKTDCSNCIQNATNSIRDICPNRPGARVWYDYCFLRYETVNFVGQVDVAGVYLLNVVNVTNPDIFNQRLGALLDEIESEAVEPESKGLGKGTSELSPFETLYALMQCTRDLSNSNCARCLSTAVSNFPRVCQNSRGCQALYSSCIVRYELYPFFFPIESNGSSVHSSGEYGSSAVPAP